MAIIWEEDKQEDDRFQVPDDVVDLSYNLSCKSLPLDHAYAFSTALHAALPWLESEQRAGVHLIHGAESGNGWFRPEDPENEILHLSRRTRMMLRMPKERIEDAKALDGVTMDIEGHSLTVGKATVKELSSLSTQFARYVVAEADESEGDFLERMVAELSALLGVNVRKILCGKEHYFNTPEGRVFTRSVMLADLDPEPAVKLQQEGLGPMRQMGCGLFIPHKGIKAVKDTH